MKRVLIILFVLNSFITQSQVGGEYIYQFLNLSTSASQIALGGEVLTLSNDINQPIFNPSMINSKIDGNLSVDYTSYLAGISIGSVSYAKDFGRRIGTIHGSIKYLDYGTLIGADQQGNETGNFGAKDVAISIGYSTRLLIPNLFVGVNLKMISSSIDTYSSFGLAGDVALLYENFDKPYVLTLVARNFGVQLTNFDGLRETLPFKLALGGSYRLQYVPLKWHLTIDNLQQWDLSVPNPSNQTTDLEGNTTQEEITFLGNAIRHFIIGAELFPDSTINLRLGYNFKRAKELELQNLRSFSGLSFGFGIQMKRFKFNYAFSNVHSASNVSTFGLEINFNASK